MSGNKHFRYYRHFGTVEDQIHLDSRVLLLGERVQFAVSDFFNDHPNNHDVQAAALIVTEAVKSFREGHRMILFAYDQAEPSLNKRVLLLRERVQIAITDFFNENPNHHDIQATTPIVTKAVRPFKEGHHMIPFLYDRTEPSASRQSVKAESSDTEMFDVEPMVSGALADAVEQVSIPSTAENNQLSTPAFPSSTITFRAINHHHGFSRPESSTTPEPPLQMNHTPMASSASPAPKTGYSSKEHDFADFENILDDDILDQIYEAEFDRSWIENYGVQGKFDLFNGKYLSRLKQEDLFRKGALKDGDNFYFETKDQIGNVVKRAVKVVGFQSEKGAGAKTPKIELAQVYPGDPPTGYKCCIGPKEIIKAVQDHYNETHDGKMVWEALTVFEDDETCFGTLHDLRQRYAFWRLVVDRFIDIRGLDGRKRPVMAALSIYKNYEPLYKMNEEEGKDEEEQEEREEEYEEAEEEESEEE